MLIGNRYKIIKKLGQGGMGEVYQAKDTILDRIVAIKVVYSSLLKKQEFLQRFLREAKITASLNHQNIVKVFDLLIDNNNYYLIMEFIDGTSLRNYLENRNEINILNELDLFLQILDGVEYAHNKNIVHRDLKPENIMLSKDRIIKITDFGLAFALGSHSLTNPGVLMGTLGYLSPEQAQGIDVDFLTDIYSLGVILYELLTNNLPIIDTNAAAMIYKILHEKPIPPSKYNPNIDKELENIILKAIEKDKAKRYKNISEFKNTIINYINKIINNQNKISVDESESIKENNVNFQNLNTTFVDKESLINQTLSSILNDIVSYKKDIKDLNIKNKSEVLEEKIKEVEDKLVINQDIYNLQSTKEQIVSQEKDTKKNINIPFLNIAKNLEQVDNSLNINKIQDKTINITLKEIEILLNKAQNYYEKKDYENTINILENLLPYYESKTMIYILAKSYFKIKNPDKALYYCNYYIDKYGKNEKILNLLGDIYYTIKDYVNSYVVFNELYKLTDNNIYLVLAARSVLNYDPNLTINILTNLLYILKNQEIDPFFYKIYKYLGLAYFKLGRYELAISNLSQYLKHIKDDTTIFPSLIKSYKLLGKNIELAKIYSSILDYIEDLETLKEAMEFYIGISEYSKAIELAKKIIEIEKDNLNIYQNLYIAAKAINDIDSLIISIENIIRLTGYNKDLLYELAQIYEIKGQYSKAINIIINLISDEEDFATKISYKEYLIELMIKNKDYENALNLIFELISINSSNPLYYERAANIYYLTGKLEEAIKNLETALSLDPTNISYYKFLAKIYLEINDINKLVSILKNLIDFNPNDIEAYILLSKVYLNLKNYFKAYENIIAARSKAFSLNIEFPLYAYDILIKILQNLYKNEELINKLKELILEIKSEKELAYIYYQLALTYWIYYSDNLKALEYSNNAYLYANKINFSPISILSASLSMFLKNQYKNAINLLINSIVKLHNENYLNKFFELKIIELLISFIILCSFDLYKNYNIPLNLLIEKLINENNNEIIDGYYYYLKAKSIELENNDLNSNSLYYYELAIKNGFETEGILFKIFFIYKNLLKDLESAKRYLEKLIILNPNERIYSNYLKELKIK
jgi:serine/threonine protein kinase/lipopolysaccharide biosynthesis regulator YciM